MDAVQIEYFKTILNEQLAKLFTQAGIALSELANQNDHEIEYLDRASVYTDQALKLKIKSRESRLIRKVRQALERIENGTYGMCEECGEPISVKRLEARPVAAKCIDCKENEERREMLVKPQS